MKVMPRIVSIVSLICFAINIYFTGVGLSSYGSGIHNSVLCFFIGLMNRNIILSFSLSAIFFFLQFFIISKCRKTSEFAARFALDSMSQKMFDIDNKLNQGLINKSEEETLKEELKQEVNFISSMDGICRFLSGIAKGNILLVIINLIGGMLIQTVKYRSSFLQAFQNNVSITVGNIVIFTIPTIILAIVVSIILRKKYQKK